MCIRDSSHSHSHSHTNSHSHSHSERALRCWSQTTVGSVVAIRLRKQNHTQQEWTSRITSEEEHEILGAMWQVLKLCLRTHSLYRVRCYLTRWKSAVFRGDICGISARWEAVCDQNKMVRRGDTKIPKMVNKVERTINWMMVKRNTPHQLPSTG